ncbi:MAG: TetR/AcrR family transcriptional regulator [Longimicrobiales bacterium]
MAESRRTYDDKLERLLRTAAAVFAEKGYHSASIRDISRATGTSLSGLYYYFRSKEELLFLIQDHCFATVLQNLQARLRDVAQPEDRLRVLVDNHLRFFVANMNEMKVLSHEAASLTGEYLQQVNAHKKQYVELCSSIMAALRPDDTAAEHRAAALSLFGMMNWIYTWYHPERDLPVEELAAMMTHVFLGGYAESAAMRETPGEEKSVAAPSMWRN